MNQVHPTAVLAPGVRLGDGVTIGPHAVLLAPCVIEDGVWVGAGAVLGAPPGDVGAPHGHWEDAQGLGVRVAPGAIVREGAHVESGRDRITTIGPGAFVMPHAHLSHDCVLGESVVVASGAVLGGTVTVLDHAFVGLNVSVHQRCVIGAHAVVGLGSAVVHDIPPFARAAGSPARILGANEVGMRRRGLEAHTGIAADLVTGRLDASAAGPLADRFTEFAAARRGTDRTLAKVAR